MTSDKIECRPTMWFTLRALIMGLVFLGFGFYFFYDAAVGYPQKNLVFFTHKAFVNAGDEFNKLSEQGKADSISWGDYVNARRIDFPAEYALPDGTARENTPWPAILADFQLMSTTGKGWSAAWQSYSEECQFPLKPEDHPFDASKVNEQWIAGSVCMVLACCAFYLLLRTRGRKMVLDGDTVTAAGTSFPIADMVRIDLRKWKVKGLAHATLNDGRKIRLDGLTYGGFNKADAPHTAEDFMQGLLSAFSGEVIDFAEDDRAEQGDTPEQPGSSERS